ncbi:hypothetical protein AM571_PB00350 (plasmid) [Rhizobium etli 8C-3]|uniref:Uncharacterized protein n=1 Tax=Rhizobium etli 8C-3 TaxID=538025 RepID=A0A1L5PBQ0_RHIET|nr:hypothetical protein AM571_PB00350 [Rhizobium etli 8C-3]
MSYRTNGARQRSSRAAACSRSKELCHQPLLSAGASSALDQDVESDAILADSSAGANVLRARSK